ncbi:MAG: hypothetical protein H6822_24250 [Planctomycetaceae bacterium]|nr:hypothetical protein [Planctomycetaceae bacterium]
MMNVPALIRLTKFPALTGIGEASIITGSRLFRLESFVRFPLPQFTTFLLVMHMAFGCCMHHAHACEVNCCSEPAVSAEACPCGTHRDEELAEVSQDGVGHDAEGDGHDQHQCAGDHCTFLHGQPTPDEVGEFVADHCPLEIAATDGNAVSVRSHLDRSLDQPLSVAGASLRTHLALHVLLI